MNYNEFGDFVGGVLNPLFALLSTAAIIFLTYIISRNESDKADIALETQKKITLYQLRQGALNNISEKLNLYVYQADKLNIHELNNGLLHQKILTRLIEEEEKDKGKVIVWIIILSELENFKQLKYLFSELFVKDDFSSIYKSLIEITGELSKEQSTIKMVNIKTLEKYITLQQKFIVSIGEYIYKEF